MEFTLPPVPASFNAPPNRVAVHAGISEPATGHLHAVGSHYKSYLRRREHNLTELDDYDTHVLPAQLEKARLAADSAATEKFTVDPVDPQLLYLDPIRWKEQDHYRVLGLGSLRHKATSVQIKKAHQQRALEFHPDKRAASGNANDDDFFKCVQKAHEVLSDPAKRRQYDSVDPEISDELPKAKLDDPLLFFDIYDPVFERESRFSKRNPVPLLGDMNAPREQVEAFYRFWTGFDSWRSYEYLDKEKEATENREEKRWQDKKNKAERMRLKKEDNRRITTLVEQAMAVDPRIEKYKEEERKEKELKRVAREVAAKKAEMEKQRAEDEKRQMDLAKAEEERKLAAEEKRRRDLKKKETRATKKAVREMYQAANYLVDNTQQTTSMTRTSRESEIDVLLDSLSQENIIKLRDALMSCNNNHDKILTLTANAITSIIEKNPAVAISFSSFVRGSEIAERVKRERQQKQAGQVSASKQREWTAEELELLIKATNKFPGGTLNRWETIGKWLSQHGGFPRRSGDELLHKTNELRKGSRTGGGMLVKELQHKKMNHDDERMANEASVRYDGPAVQMAAEKPVKKEAKPERPWTPQEQAQLERALQAYPPSYKAPDRWDKIAEAVDGRTKKECKLRVKYLAEQVRAKKAAAGS